jgi:hypothetical protein
VTGSSNYNSHPTTLASDPREGPPTVSPIDVLATVASPSKASIEDLPSLNATHKLWDDLWGDISIPLASGVDDESAGEFMSSNVTAPSDRQILLCDASLLELSEQFSDDQRTSTTASLVSRAMSAD